MEKDHGKYLLYMAALAAAAGTLVSATSPEDETKRRSAPLKCLTVGPGLGRLITFCLDAARLHGLDAVVHVLEANPRALVFLEQRFASEISEGRVVLHDPHTLRHSTEVSDLPAALMPHAHSFDIIVAELLGSFGDNEFLPELMHRAAYLFSKKDGITIPDRWTTYVAPIHCTSIYAHAAKGEDKEERHRNLHTAYVTGIPADAVLLGPLHPLYEASCLEPPSSVYSGEFYWDLPADRPLEVHGFVGYFTCHLFGGIELDSRHAERSRNTFHWESMFFPLEAPLRLSSNQRIGVRLRRCSSSKRLDIASKEHAATLPDQDSAHKERNYSPTRRDVMQRITETHEFYPLVSVTEADLAQGKADLYALWYEWQLLLPNAEGIVHNKKGKHQSLFL